MFDFTRALTEPAESIDFWVPEDVSELDQKYGEGRVLDPVTITATEAENPSQCAVEYQSAFINVSLERFWGVAEFQYSGGGGDAANAACCALAGESSGC
ncbi:hypothetical protein KGD82_22775 [Nocardiopsis eucommiae]|uniref:Uncharacterized protein n=1 Tax=Nocardiopsis eucommiae TaxID=2831970 RepID=A0A975L8H9_9ACTN|nr:hypothetical protein KGD82_22775 [Nocardiopsis eucommiae]